MTITMTYAQRRTIFEEGQEAAAQKQSRTICPYLSDETPERTYIWMGGFDAIRP